VPAPGGITRADSSFPPFASVQLSELTIQQFKLLRIGKGDTQAMSESGGQGSEAKSSNSGYSCGE